MPASPPPSDLPSHVHLFQPGHADSARHAVDRGWPKTYVAVCVLCGAAVDLLRAATREDRPPGR